MSEIPAPPRARPLEGVRVLDLSRMIAGGVSGMILGDFGADVVKVEQPGSGDPLRQWTSEGAQMWWQVYGRNKRYVTLNLKSAEGQDLLRRLIPRFDVVLESFVPGTLERMGLGYDVLQSWNPKLITVHGFPRGSQTGPSSQRRALALVEAASGFAAMNGEPGGAPIVPAYVSVGDMTSALCAVNAVMFALYHRDVHGGPGQVVDVALFESLFSLLGPLAADAASGRLRGATAAVRRMPARAAAMRPVMADSSPSADRRRKMAERFLAGLRSRPSARGSAVRIERGTRATRGGAG